MEHLGAPERTLGAPGSTWKCRRQVWEHLTSRESNLGKTSCSLGMLFVRLDIIATTYHSMIIKTHVFSWYPDLCIYIATLLHTVYPDGLQSVLGGNLR